ncbi:hypothetical protein GCM10010289_59410 [Streptomyces violascens]|nr:hypothetical protein GCM10010289_59410 [Streptomyces violascens]
MSEAFGFLKPSGFHDLAPSPGENGQGQTDESGEAGAGLDDGAGRSVGAKAAFSPASSRTRVPRWRGCRR